MISLSGVTKSYGQRTLLANASFQMNKGDKVGLVGPNGAGKTTLFRIISGDEGVDTGQISVPSRSIIGYFSQETGEMKGRSALEEVMASAGKVTKLGERIKVIEKLLEGSAESPMPDDEMMKLVEEYTESQEHFQHAGGYDLDSRAKIILTGLGIGPDDFNRPVESFSGGWKMRIALAGILLLNPDILLMDEPTNHLDMESIEWLETWLRDFDGALLMTSHDREFMNRLVNRIVEVSSRDIISYTGNYDFYERERGIRREQLVAAHKKQQDMLAKEEDFIARFAARASHAAQVQSRVKKIDKIERVELPVEESVMHFHFADPPRSGNDVVVMKDLAKVYDRPDGKAKSVFHGVTGLVRRLDKIAVVGVNGAGKSTLLKTMTGEVPPTEGQVTLGSNVQLGYFSQYSLDLLNPNASIYEEVYSRVPEASIGYVRSLCGAFLFSGDDVHKKIGVLSGGEKSRVILATILANPVNLLVLDEPTNHLDIKSREVLLQALKDFDGTVVIVSHDRHFLRSLATRVFEVDHGEMRSFEGDFDYYREKTKFRHQNA